MLLSIECEFMKNRSTVQGQTIPGSYTLVLLLLIGVQILEIPICQKNSHVS